AVLERGPRTVVVAGDGAGPAARELAEAAGWPLLAEPTSGARSGPSAIGPYRLLLAEPALGGAVERVVVMGRPTLSRPVSALLARTDVEVVVVAPHGAWTDVAGTASAVVTAVVVDGDARGTGVRAAGSSTRAAGARGAAVVSAGDVAGTGGPEPAVTQAADHEWLARWQGAAAAAGRTIEEYLAREPADGLHVAREVAAADVTLVVGSSNTVRDVDLVATPRAAAGAAPRTIANRGLAGIDGTVATATGLALGTGLPVRAVMGDLTFLHDAGALARGRLEQEVDLQVVVLNDSGGGIFATLEHGEPERSEQFERIFGTPQDVDLGALAAGYGASHRRVGTAAELRAALAEPVTGRSVLEVTVDRAGLRARRERLVELVRAAVRTEIARA
ncbi:thiamine pyrophosphate-dependent enzyme, partial [Georgenia subflava]